jgi:LysM repeat protein
MSVDQIYRDFQAIAASGAISGDAPVGLADLLGSLNVASLTIQNAQAFIGPDSAWLTATLPAFLNTNWTIKLIGRDGLPEWPANRASLQLTLSGIAQPPPWTFGQAFPPPRLPKSRREVDREGGGMILGPSVIDPLVLDQVEMIAANTAVPGARPPPRLQGWLVLAGSILDRYQVYFGAARLWAAGTVDLAADPVLLLMDAPAPNAQLGFGPLQLQQAGLRLWTRYPDPAPLPDEGAPTSAALVYGRITAATTPPRVVDISAPLLTGDHIWPLFAVIEPPLNMSGGVQLLTSLIGDSDANNFTLPSGIAALDEFGVSNLEFGVYPPNADGDTLAYSSVTIVSTTPWSPPIPFLSFENVGVTWTFDWLTGKTLVTATIFGTMVFGASSSRGGDERVAAAPPLPKINGPGSPGAAAVAIEEHVEDAAARITVLLELPQLGFSAYNRGDIAIPIADAFEFFFNNQPADAPDLKISSLNVEASFLRQTYQGELTIDGVWPLKAGPITFNLDRIELQIAVSQSSVSGQLAGTCTITPDGGTPFSVMMSATYPGTGHWIFELGLINGPIKLMDFVKAFLGSAAPSWLNDFDVNIVDFAARYSTDEDDGNPYRVSCKVEVIFNVLGTSISLTVEGMIERKLATGTADHALARIAADTDPQVVTIGSLTGTFTILRFAITAGLSLNEKNQKTYQFSVRYRDLLLSATTSKSSAGNDLLTIRLSGATLGSVVEYLVSLANPNANFRLEPPWDFLNTIDLGRFALVIDSTANTVTLTYDVNLTLPFISIEKVGLRYDRASGTSRVNFVIYGQFLDNDYSQKPLEWDAVNENPPAVPGAGQQLFDLRYLGLGQHVTLKNLTTYDSIAEVIDKLRQDMAPPKDPAKVPLGPEMRFDATSQWMLGLDCTVMDTVTLKLVLHDPDLYGVLISLAGPEAGSLAGLSFELLYKKVTDTIGVFHVRLQVPDAFRQLQFGAVSVTLGIVTVDIYTNGNFRVDLGFPHNRDFSVSFAVEAGIFNGHGGLYFGLLDGSTSTRVPKVTNGNFSPVIELGVGLAVGVGRTYEKGPLSAGLYLDVVVIFEGTIGWFHPNDAGQPTATYYWCRGSAGLTGKLYGSVDFKIISVSISIEAHATVMLTLAAYEATLVELDVGVEVHASVHFLFFSVSFSFSLTLSASFTIGSSSAPPWILAPGESGRQQDMVAASAFTPPRRRQAQVVAHTRNAYRQMRFARRGAPVNAAMTVTVVAEAADGYHLQFDPNAKVFPDQQVHTATLKVIPAFTVADVPVDWTGTGPPPPNLEPHYRIAFVIMADTAVQHAPESIVATHQASVALNAHAQTTSDTSLNVIVEGMLRWSLNALGVQSPTATVSLGQLEELVAQLALPEAANLGFTWDNLTGFFTNNLNFVLSGPPAGDPEGLGGVLFPMLPPLKWTSPDLPPPENDRDFSQYQQVDAAYEAYILAYFADLDARPPGDRPSTTRRLATAAPAGTESMATFVFRDYFALAARATVQAAVNLLSAFPHEVASSDSLAGIANGFAQTQVAYVKRPNDTVDQVALFFGMSVDELLALNDPGFADRLAATQPGAAIAVTLGVTPQSIAGANPNWPVVANVPLSLGTLSVQVQANDTLAAIAGRYGLAVDAWLQTTDVLDAAGLLRAGATVALTAFNYANPNSLSVAQVAAVFYVRLPVLGPGAQIPLREWYAERIIALNPNVDWNGPVSGVITVPAALYSTATTTWTALPGDTIDAIAGYFALAQNVVAGSDYATWLQAVQQANQPAPPSGVALPASAVVTVLPDDTLTALRLRLLFDPTIPAQAAAFRDLVKPAPLLMALAPVNAIGVNVQTGAGLTLVTLAQNYGLPLEDLAARVATVTGLLATSADKRLIVPNVPAIALDALVTALNDPASAATIASQISRFMLHGLRLPTPTDHSKMAGLYDLIGQQVTGPTPINPPPQPPPTLLTLTIEKSQTAGWLSFADSIVTAAGDTVAGLGAAHPAVPSLNPALARRADEHAQRQALTASGGAAAAGEVPPGMIVLTQAADAIVITLNNDQLRTNYPDIGLVAAIIGSITPLPLYREVAVRHPLAQVIRWQTTVAPLMPAATAPGVVPSLWLLPADLQANAVKGMSNAAYVLKQTSANAAPTTQPAELGAYAWGMAIDIGIRSIPGFPGTVEVLGADTADRQRLALLLEYLNFIPRHAGNNFPPLPTGEGAHISLAWQLPPSGGLPPGLTSTKLVESATFLIKANLSTETHSGPSGALGVPLVREGDPTSGPYFASIADADAARFLALMWECSVVGGGGYWLHYQGDGAEVPQSIFDQNGLATFSLVIQLESQSTTSTTAPTWPVRNIFAFNNCAVVGDGVDPGSVALFAEAKADAELTRVATVPPGQVGFTLDITSPGTAPPTTAQAALQQLYSLMGYQLADTTAFKPSSEGQPLGPQVKEEPDGKKDESIWHLMRVVPIASFAKQSFLPPETVMQLPPRREDPYAGISSDQPDPIMANTAVGLWFHDVLGNASASPGGSSNPKVDVPVGYTDPLIGAGGWPSTTLNFLVTTPSIGSPQAAQLTVNLTLQGVVYQPGAGESGSAAKDKAERDAEAFAAVYYQIMQPDVLAALLTSLQQAAGAEPDALSISMLPLRNFATGAYLLLNTIAKLGPYTPAAALALTLDGIVGRYGVNYDSIGDANAKTALNALLAASTLAVPQMVAFTASQSVKSICDQIGGLDPATVLGDPDNIVLPLMTAIALDITQKTVAVVGDPASVDQLLARFNCTLENLVALNQATASLLSVGFGFEYNGFVLTVSAPPLSADVTLVTVAQQFGTQYGVTVTPSQLVPANAAKPGMFRLDAQLAISTWVIKQGETLDHNGSGQSAATLAPLNISTVDLFPIGTPLFLKTNQVAVPVPPPPPEPLPVEDTLGGFAAVQGVLPGNLLRHNGSATLATNSAFAVPGLLQWPANLGDVFVPYTIRSADMLTTIAACFVDPTGSTSTITALALATINVDVPGTIRGGITISVDGHTVPTQDGDSFDTVRNRFVPPVTLDALVSAIASATGVLAAGGLLICPPGRLGPAVSQPSGVTPTEAAARYGLTASEFLGANAGIPDLIVPGQQIVASPTLATTEQTVQADSMTAILERFRRRGITTSIADIAAANADNGFLTPNATVLVPPATASLNQQIGTVQGDVVTWKFPDAVFPIHVWLQIARDYDLVDADLRGSRDDPTQAVRDRTAIAAARSGTGDDQPDGGAMTLVGFATKLEGAMPGVRVATGKMLSEQESVSGSDVWAVAFTDSWIKRVTVTPPLTVEGTTGPQPRSFALRPLVTTLIGRQDVEIKLIDPNTGNFSGSETRNYQGVDLEVWAKAFLADVDLVLSAAYAPGAYALNSPALEQIITAKKNLAGFIARGLDYVLQGEAPSTGADPNRAQAIDTLGQELLISLAQGYETSAVIQFDSAAQSTWTSKFARLSGYPKSTLSVDDPALKAMTISNGKVSLTNGSAPVSFVLYVPDVAAHEAIELALAYNVVEFEFRIVDEFEGYEKSDWLKFVNPVASGAPPALSFNLGTPKVPLPLRAYPPMPILLDHNAVVPVDQPAPIPLDAAVKWRYRILLRQQTTEQDEIRLQVDYNTALGFKDPGPSLNDDLFGNLAQYTDAAGSLMSILGGLRDYQKSTDPGRLRNALGTFAQIAQDVATAWDHHWVPLLRPEGLQGGARAGTGPLPEIYEYVMTLQAVPEPETGQFIYQTLRLERTRNAKPNGVGWPTIVCITPDGTRHILEHKTDGTICGCPADGDCTCYEFTDTVAAFIPLDFEIEFPDLHIASYQSATAKVSVTRNARLLGPDGAATTAGFVYRTPETGYAEAVVPFINLGESIAIGPWSYDPTQGPLGAMFDTIFDQDDSARTIACGVRYGFVLAPGDPPAIPPIEAYLPVKQSLMFSYVAVTTIADITSALQEWSNQYHPESAGGRWAFWINLYSSLDPNLQRPLLQLKHLVSKLQ